MLFTLPLRSLAVGCLLRLRGPPHVPQVLIKAVHLGGTVITTLVPLSHSHCPVGPVITEVINS